MRAINLLFFASATALYQPLGAHLRHHRAAVVAMDTADTAKQAKLYAIMAQLAKEDAEKKTANKEEECNSELAALKTDLELIAKIQEKMATLTTVDNDILGAKAEADARRQREIADFIMVRIVR